MMISITIETSAMGLSECPVAIKTLGMWPHMHTVTLNAKCTLSGSYSHVTDVMRPTITHSHIHSPLPRSPHPAQERAFDPSVQTHRACGGRAKYQGLHGTARNTMPSTLASYRYIRLHNKRQHHGRKT